MKKERESGLIPFFITILFVFLGGIAHLDKQVLGAESMRSDMGKGALSESPNRGARIKRRGPESFDPSGRFFFAAAFICGKKPSQLQVNPVLLPLGSKK